MKTLLKYFSKIDKYSTWIDPNGKYVCVEDTNWFINYSFYPMVIFYYLVPDSDNKELMCVDRYTFCKYMKLHLEYGKYC